MRQWLQQKEYISPIIINEMIVLMGQTLLKEIIANVRDSLWHSLIADETTDVSRIEQLSVTIQWVDKAYQVHEHTLRLKNCKIPKLKLFSMKLKMFLLDVHCLCLNVGGRLMMVPSNMSRVKNSVQAIFKREEPRELYVHC